MKKLILDMFISVSLIGALVAPSIARSIEHNFSQEAMGGKCTPSISKNLDYLFENCSDATDRPELRKNCDDVYDKLKSESPILSCLYFIKGQIQNENGGYDEGIEINITFIEVDEFLCKK